MGLFKAKYTPEQAASQCLLMTTEHHAYIYEQLSIEQLNISDFAKSESIYLRLMSAVALAGADNALSHHDATTYGHRFADELERIIKTANSKSNQTEATHFGALLFYLDKKWYKSLTEDIKLVRADKDAQKLADKIAEELINAIPYIADDIDKYEITINLFCRTQAIKLSRAVDRSKFTL